MDYDTFDYSEHVDYVDEVRIPRWVYHKMLDEIDRGRQAIIDRDNYFDILWQNHMDSFNIGDALKFAEALGDYTEKVKADAIKEVTNGV